MSAARDLDPYSALRISNFRDYLLGSSLALVGRQAVLVAATWQVYAWTHSSAALGFVGFVNVLPLIVLSLPAGAFADRHDRKRIIATGTALLAGFNLALAVLAWGHASVPMLPPLRWGNAVIRWAALLFEHHTDPSTLHFDEPALPLVFALLCGHACVRIFIWPARTSLTPLLVPSIALRNAITWNTSAFEIATITGPALGGLLFDWLGAAAVYGLGSALEIAFFLLIQPVKYFTEPVRSTAQRSWSEVLAGARFIWRKKAILGASSLDLFAVLLGGVVMLLTVYAADILHVGPAGAGWLRAAPSIGAVSMAIWTAHRQPWKRPGVALLWAVAGFGAATMVFGWSRWFWLSFVTLVLTGALDNISVVVRQSLVQMMTPDALRGRVTAVNQIFVGSSNEIGGLRAGLMAAAFGPVNAVVWGGVGTIAVVAAIAVTVPALVRLAPLHSLKAES